MKQYVCGICGKDYDDLNDYVSCVASCGKKMQETKRMEEVNLFLNKVKAAKDYYEQQLDAFKEKFPEEYKLNFGECEKHCSCHTEKSECENKTETPGLKSLEIFGEIEDGNLKITAKENGKDITGAELEKLLGDYGTNIEKILGIL